MPRARNIKPGFYRDAALVELPVETRLLFPGLWMLADRAGRLEDKPKQIKMEIYPADCFDVDVLLNQLQDAGLIVRYVANGIKYIQVVNFDKHQNPHRDEKPSTIPAPSLHSANTAQAPCLHGGNRADSLIPDSLTPDSLIPKKNKESASQDSITIALATDCCARLVHLGFPSVSPSHPQLLALLSAGITADEIVDAASGANGKPLAWVLAKAEGRRRDAAAVSVPAAPGAPEDRQKVCACCGSSSVSKKIGRDWYCSSHDQYSERTA